MAQTNQSASTLWLAKSELAPSLTLPKTKGAWELQRKQVRAELWSLLGKLPPRPKVPKVQILSRDERDDYICEKFEFDNEAGATVPGYIVLPKKLAGKGPAILFCHWHGGEYDIGKEELFQNRHTPEPWLRGPGNRRVLFRRARWSRTGRRGRERPARRVERQQVQFVGGENALGDDFAR
jgi:hypothetical protein